MQDDIVNIIDDCETLLYLSILRNQALEMGSFTIAYSKYKFERIVHSCVQTRIEMNNKLIITIGREFGAEGHEIGKKLGERIGFELYDKDMLALAAQKSGIDIKVLAPSDETYYGHALSPYLTIGRLSPSMGDKLFKLQTDIINDLAVKGSCIIVGRLADYILKDNPNCIKAFIYAPFEKRVEIIKNKHAISEADAKKLVKRMDNERRNYYTYYSNGKWDRKEGKDILLNRATFGVDGCVDILEAMVRSRD